MPTWSHMSSHFFSLSYWLSSWTLSGGKFMQFWGGRQPGEEAESGDPTFRGAWASSGDPLETSSLRVSIPISPLEISSISQGEHQGPDVEHLSEGPTTGKGHWDLNLSLPDSEA